MKSFSIFAFVAITIACGNSPAQKEDAELVLSAEQANDACNRLVEGDVRLLRQGQTIWYKNDSNRNTSLEIASGPSADCGTYLLYDLPPHSSQKLTLPFFEMAGSSLYLRLDEGEWQEICRQ